MLEPLSPDKGLFASTPFMTIFRKFEEEKGDWFFVLFKKYNFIYTSLLGTELNLMYSFPVLFNRILFSELFSYRVVCVHLNTEFYYECV